MPASILYLRIMYDSDYIRSNFTVAYDGHFFPTARGCYTIQEAIRRLTAPRFSSIPSITSYLEATSRFYLQYENQFLSMHRDIPQSNQYKYRCPVQLHRYGSRNFRALAPEHGQARPLHIGRLSPCLWQRDRLLPLVSFVKHNLYVGLAGSWLIAPGAV